MGTFEMPYCECGCGKRVGLATKTSSKWGLVKGQPTRFVRHHHPQNGPRWFANPDGCWIWNRMVDKHGYGMSESFGRRVTAHRAVWEERYGIRLPREVHLDHLCRVTLCVNPDHMEPVTPAENQRRSRNTKLTAEAAEVIRNAVGTNKSIGIEFGVSARTVGEIRRGAKWVPDDTTLVDHIKALMAQKEAS